MGGDRKKKIIRRVNEFTRVNFVQKIDCFWYLFCLNILSIINQ